MQDCFFCNKGLATANNIVFEDDYFYGRLDDYPVSFGHTEVIVKRHINDISELTNEEWGKLREAIGSVIEVVADVDILDRYRSILKEPISKESKQLIEKIIDKQKGLGPSEGYNLGINTGIVAGQTIPHLHVHVIPRYRGDVPNPTGGIRNMFKNKGEY